MPRVAKREILVGLVMLVGLVALLVMMSVATGGPAFLASRRPVEVLFRDVHGIRVGSPVRVAGMEAGRVERLDLTDIEGELWVNVRLSLPKDLAARLRQDVKITIESGLIGQGCVNIVSSGRSDVALVPGQVIRGVESSFFDPILEQVGLGPVERSHLSHTVAEVRETVDTVGPRIRQILAALHETVDSLRETADAVRPSIVATTGHVEEVARRVEAASPQVEAALKRLDSLTAQLDETLNENRPNVQATLTSVRELSAMLKDIVETDRVKLEQLLDGLNVTRQRADLALHKADTLLGQGVEMLAHNRADIERTVTNVRDATDWADRLVQKLYANPFLLSPFHKPTPEDTRVQTVYDTAQVFTKGAKELSDAVKTLEAMQGTAMSPNQQEAFHALYQRAWAVTQQLGETSERLAEGLKPSVGQVRRR